MNKRLNITLNLYIITTFFILSCTKSELKQMYNQKYQVLHKKENPNFYRYNPNIRSSNLGYENFDVLFSFKNWTFVNNISCDTIIKNLKTELKNDLLNFQRIKNTDLNKDIDLYYIGTKISPNLSIKQINTNHGFKRDFQNGQLILIKLVD